MGEFERKGHFQRVQEGHRASRVEEGWGGGNRTSSSRVRVRNYANLCWFRTAETFAAISHGSENGIRPASTILRSVVCKGCNRTTGNCRFCRSRFDRLGGFLNVRSWTFQHRNRPAPQASTEDRRSLWDEYVRVTVTLATVLLLMAISQRFKDSWCAGWTPRDRRVPALLSALPYPFAPRA